MSKPTEYEKRVNKENGKLYGTDAKAAYFRNMKPIQTALSGNFFKGVDPQLDAFVDKAIALRQEALETEAQACEYLKSRVEKK